MDFALIFTDSTYGFFEGDDFQSCKFYSHF